MSRFLTAFWLRSTTFVQCYAPTATSDVVQKVAFQLRFRGGLPKVTLKGDLNAKVGFDNTLLGHGMGKHGFVSRNDNGGKFGDFCSLHRLVIGSTLFEQRVCGNPTDRWVSINRHRMSNYAISRRFRNCIVDVRNKRGAGIGSEKDHYLMVVCVLRPLLFRAYGAGSWAPSSSTSTACMI